MFIQRDTCFCVLHHVERFFRNREPVKQAGPSQRLVSPKAKKGRMGEVCIKCMTMEIKREDLHFSTVYVGHKFYSLIANKLKVGEIKEILIKTWNCLCKTNFLHLL